MRNPQKPTGTAAEPSLISEWKSASLGQGWLFPEDWDGVAVRDLVHAYAQRHSLATAVSALGKLRAYQGVGIGETMRDLSAFFATVGLGAADELMRVLVEAWTEENSAAVGSGLTDPATGLATLPYLERLLYDLTACPEQDRENLQLTRLTLVLPALKRHPAWAVLADIGRIFTEEFEGTRAVAVVHGTSMYILMRSTSMNAEAVSHMVERLERAHRQSGGRVGSSSGPLPSNPRELSAMIAELRQPRNKAARY